MRARLALALAFSLFALSCGGPEEEVIEDDEGDAIVTDTIELAADSGRTTVTPANNRDALKGIVKVIDAARRRLDVVQYVYLFDRAGTAAVNDAIGRAIARGVKVNVLLDNGPSDNANAATQLRALGATVKLDAPTRVTHNKFFLADAKRFFVGSANLSSESLNKNNEVNVIVSSTSLGLKLRGYFDAIWANSAAFATITNNASATTRLLADGQYGASALTAINAARKRVRLVMYATRYYASNRAPPIRDQLVDALRNAKARGVDVKVVLESSTNAWDRTTSEDNRNTTLRLRAGNVEVRFDPPAVRTHAKLLVADNIVQLGSTNWTSTALEAYHATDLRLKGTSIANRYVQYFEQQWAAARP